MEYSGRPPSSWTLEEEARCIWPSAVLAREVSVSVKTVSLNSPFICGSSGPLFLLPWSTPPPQGSSSWPPHANLGGRGIFLRTELVGLGKLEKLIHVMMCFVYNIEEFFSLLMGRHCVYFLGLEMHILFHVNNYKVKVYTGYGVIYL